MKPNQLAIIVAFYLSKYDKIAKHRLGYKTDSEAFQNTADILGIKKNYVKFRRDEFDPIHPWRKGWHRPMDIKIVRAIEALQDLSENDLGEIVWNILNNPEYRASEDVSRITHLIDDEKTVKRNTKGNYVLRGPTGRKAEDFFIAFHHSNQSAYKGQLNDTRDFGCGYDFEISGDENWYIEVKGLAKNEGGILFTNKEWEVACKYKDQYILAIVSNLDSSPEIKFIPDPTTSLKAKKSIITTVQVQWSVSNNELQGIDD